jgi:hypothetical protein
VAVAATAGFPSVAMAMPIESGAASVPVTPPVSTSHANLTASGPTDASSDGYAVASPTALGPTDASSGGYDFVARSVPVTAQPGSGFDWGDAGIGAAGMVVLVGAGAAASVSIRRHHARVVTG